MKKTLVLVLLAANLSGYAQQGGRTIVMATNTEMRSALPEVSSLAQISFTVNTFRQANGTWAYDILANGNELFHQQDMPGKEKGVGFSTKADAETVARAVIELLKNPVRPPAIFITDLKKMNIK